jgi:hypothetical protein
MGKALGESGHYTSLGMHFDAFENILPWALAHFYRRIFQQEIVWNFRQTFKSITRGC